jgi:hypothetical protein
MMKKLSKKWIVTLVCVVLLACVSVGSTLAYIFTKTMPLDNSFNPVYLTCETVGNVKTGVKVKNTGTTDGYIRAIVVVNWVKELDNSVHATAVTEGVDYTATWNTSNWQKGTDGFYYYTAPVGVGLYTETLVSDFTRLTEPPQGYTLTAKVLVSAIQTEPTLAVESVWTVTVLANGNLSVR